MPGPKTPYENKHIYPSFSVTPIKGEKNVLFKMPPAEESVKFEFTHLPAKHAAVISHSFKRISEAMVAILRRSAWKCP